MVANSTDGAHIEGSRYTYRNASLRQPNSTSAPSEGVSNAAFDHTEDGDKAWANGIKAPRTTDHITISISPADNEKKRHRKWSFFKKKQKPTDKLEKEKEIENGKRPVNTFQLFRYSNCKERLLIGIALVAATAAGLCMPALIVLFGEITNSFIYHDINVTAMAEQYNVPVEFANMTYLSVYEDDFFGGLVKFGTATGVVALIQMLTGYIFVTCLNYAAEEQVHRIRTQFLRATLRQEMGWFDTHKTNDFASKVTEDLNKLQEGMGEKVGMLVFFVVTFVANIINAFIHGWELTLVVMSVFPLLAITTALTSKIQATLTTREVAEYSKAGSIAEEVLGAIKTVSAFGGEAKEVKRYEANLIHARRAGVRRGLFTGISLGLVWLIIYASYCIAFWYGSGLIIEHRFSMDRAYDPAVFVVVFFSVMIGALNMGQAVPFFEALNIARGSAANVFDVLERPSAIDPMSQEGRRLGHVEGTLEFRKVQFQYPSRRDVPVLQRLSLQVLPGQTVALVGASGCGKSTCVQLLQRFYDPSEGAVTLDSVDLRELNIGWLRDQIGVVGQEPVLFATTIEENIRYGRDGLSFDDVIAAAKQANAHDFIMKLPQQYQTQVGDRGAQMSGGQKQRLAIARALVKQPKVLLLDEATSALDNQSEALVQNALDKARLGRTTIIVAHRLTTIRSADVIVALKDGRAEEIGSHEQLMDKRGLYYSLVTAQLYPSEKKDVLDVNRLVSSEYEVDTELGLHSNILEEIADITTAALARTPSKISFTRRRRKSSSASAGLRPTLSGHKGLSQIVPEAEKKTKESQQTMSMGEILKENKSEWPFMTIGALGSVIMGSCTPIYANIFGNVLGTLSIADPEIAREEGNYYSLCFLGIGAMAAISICTQAYAFALSGESLTMRLRIRAFSKILSHELAWFDQDENSVGALCSRLSGDASAVQGATGARLGTILQSVTTVGLSLSFALYYDWRLGLLCFPFYPLVLVAVYLQSKIISGQSISESDVLEQAGKIAIEAISNVRTVASLHKEEHFTKLYADTLYEPHRIALRNSHLRGLAFGFAQCVPFVAYAAVMLFGGYLVTQDAIPYENVFKVAEALIIGTIMVGQAVAFAPNYTKGKVAATRIFKLLERVSRIDSSNSSGRTLTEKFDDVRLHDVHFRYPNRKDMTILQGLSLTVCKGKTLALVGPSGCGKSTVISLIERFYDPEKGKVTINGADLKELNVGSVRRGLGLVSQEPVLFDLTIEENIAYGDNSREVPHSEIVAAAQQANISGFIESLPEKYKTRVGAKGTQMSGGQKQRIAIARALIRNPSVLMLDEATSALDTESESVVQAALDKAQAGRTSIVIAHRLSTIQGADTIAVISNGKMVESGTHDELMALGGQYFNLYQTNQ